MKVDWIDFRDMIENGIWFTYQNISDQYILKNEYGYVCHLYKQNFPFQHDTLDDTAEFESFYIDLANKKPSIDSKIVGHTIRTDANGFGSVTYIVPYDCGLSLIEVVNGKELSSITVACGDKSIAEAARLPNGLYKSVVNSSHIITANNSVVISISNAAPSTDYGVNIHYDRTFI